jgi:hypothetical protein
LTVTLPLPEPLLPEGSWTVQFTAVVPTGKVEPEGGTQFVEAIEQLSEAVGV